MAYEENLQTLIREIQKKRELAGLDPAFIKRRLGLLLAKDRKAQERLEGETAHLLRSGAIKGLIKAVRADLRLAHGMFQSARRPVALQLLSELGQVLKTEGPKSEESLRIHHELLALHRSTKERLPSYTEFYRRIFALTDKPGSILDLGCGIAPISWVFMGCKPTIHARELSVDDVALLEEYYPLVGLEGTVERCDLLKQRDFPRVDLCLMLKLIDVLENEQRGVVHGLFDAIQAEWLIVSFATKTLGGKPMRTSRRWFENVLKHRDWSFEIVEFSDERVYVIQVG